MAAGGALLGARGARDGAEGRLALVDDPQEVVACLHRLEAGTIALACGHFEAGADAVLLW